MSWQEWIVAPTQEPLTRAANSASSASVHNQRRSAYTAKQSCYSVTVTSHSCKLCSRVVPHSEYEQDRTESL